MTIPKAVNVSPLENHQLEVVFSNGERRIFDANPYLQGEWFAELLDEKLFTTVHIAGLSIEWADGQDICPDCLYLQSQPIQKTS